MTSVTFGGAIAYVGATRDAWPGVSELVAETVTRALAR